ncbi:MAG TPA: rRNA maturation RNase YbeY [Terriglobales bacterium]|nr:rRNA maturation RNase YbeY [Terriglobales bacterium]
MIIARKRVPGLSDAALSRFVRRAGKAAGLAGTVNVLLTNSIELRSLNSRFRNKDKSTDVLSFPVPAELRPKFAGELAISVDIAARNARELGHSAANEIKILTLHGLLHLAGYDHEQDRGEMAQTELRLRRAFRLPGGLIERAASAPAGRSRPLARPRKREEAGRMKVR